MNDFIWLYVGVLLLAMWNGVAREMKNAIAGYLIQTLLVATLYASQAIRFHNTSMWVSLVGLLLIRGALIPGILIWKLPGSTLQVRQSGYVITPTYMILTFVSIALLALGTTEAAGGSLSAPFGAALATLMIGLVSVALSHDADKQVMGFLTADNGTDLAVVTVIQRVSVFGDYVVFLDIALAVIILVVLILKLRQTGSLSINDYHELKG